ncbi:hypothetical protein GQ53DRAFT_355365 [Thozetella sp. PMI_491]|nr:hypothetical protein GQ53DRAFT_355365 [Thozetella sp. PMI_491]
MTEQMAQLQEQVETLFNNMNSLRQETLQLAPVQDRALALPSNGATPSPSISSAQSLPRPPFPSRIAASFSGPTSTTFTVDVAKNTLHKMGYSGAPDCADDTAAAAAAREEALVVSPAAGPPSSDRPTPRPRDPLWDYDKDEMIRLCRVHEEEVGIMYPVVKIEAIIKHAEFLGAWLQTWKQGRGLPLYGEGDGISDMNSLLLKMVMCSALVVEEHGNSPRAAQLYGSIQHIIDRKLMSEAPDVANLPLLALAAGYRFLSNDEIIAWRVMGQVARLCFELGLHRRDGLESIKDPQHRKNALNTFWSAYVLDRRWSFGTGLPYVCHDDKIDPKLPYPDDHPYLVAMITYSRLGAKIWRLVDYFEPAVIRELKRNDFEQLDHDILSWYDSVPKEVQIGSLDPDMIPVPSGPNYDLERLQIWTRLRLNQIRIWLYTPVLHSASSIAENITLAERVVGLAKDTIVYLTRLNKTTQLYRRIQTFYHQFLTSAIGVLFLASTHAPLQFSGVCRTEFYMALELIKDLSTRSWVSQRLWRTIGSLKSYATRLGMEEQGSRAIVNASVSTPASGYGRASSTAPSVQSPSPFPPPFSDRPTLAPKPPSTRGVPTPAAQQATQQIAEDHTNGLSLQTEMSRIYEGYMGMNGIPSTPLRSPEQSHHFTHSSVAELMDPAPARRDGAGTGRNTNGSVYQHFKDMF